MTTGAGRVKVAFKLTRDEEGWPPADWETVWAIPRGPGQFELDNIPFFAQGVSSGDVIAAHTEDGELRFDEVVAPGGHSTVRVILYDVTRKEEMRELLKNLGAPTEGSHLPSLFAVDVPPAVDYERVIALLDEHSDVLEYEESAISIRRNSLTVDLALA